MASQKTLTVTMTWNEPLQKWLMHHAKNKVLIYDFFDCGNVRLAFKGWNKKKIGKYRITIEHLED